MKRLLALALLVLAGGWFAFTFVPRANAVAPADSGRRFDRIVSIVLENTDYETSMKLPYFQKLVARGALLSNFNGVNHPSYPNYLAMIAGTDFGVHDDNQREFNALTLADLLERKGLTWKAYAENYPGHCYLSDTSGHYARRHVPFLSFTSIQGDPARCARVVAGTQFVADLDANALPTFSIYVPDVDDDGHDTGAIYADHWLESFLEPILNNRALMKGTLLEVTYDESATASMNHIATLLIGPAIRAGTVDAGAYTHYNILRTIEENFGLGTLGANDLKAAPISAIWVN